MTVSDGRASKFFWGWLLLLGLLLIAVQFRLRAMSVTGDEPGYIYKSLSFWQTGGFHMPYARFGREMPQFEWIVASGSYLGAGHPVFMSMLGAPFLGLFGINGVRALSCLFGLGAVIATACLLRRPFGAGIALFATAFMIFTLPALAYTHLFYTETMMTLLVAVSWALGRAGGRNFALLAVACALLLPFVHIRAALLSPVLVLFALLPLYRQHDWRGLAAAVALCGLGGGLFVLQQFLLFGQLVAGASASFPATLGGVLPRLAVQLTTFRHGLLTVNPACILALAGLVLGLWRRSGLAAQAVLLLLVYVPPMVFGTASESWPARFWTPVMPVMAVGMGFWLAGVRGAPARAAGFVLILAALMNGAILIRDNDSFLFNRLGDLSGDAYFPWHNHFDVAGLLPWDRYDFEIAGIDPALALDARLLHRAMIFVAVLLLAFAINLLAPARAAKWTGWLPAAALLPLFVAAAMRPVAPALVTVSRAGQSVVLTYACPAPVRLIRLMAPDRGHMFPPDYPTALRIVALRAAGGQAQAWQAPLAPVVAIPSGTYRAIRLTGVGSGAGGVWRQERFVTLTAGLQPLRCPEAAPAGPVQRLASSASMAGNPSR